MRGDQGAASEQQGEPGKESVSGRSGGHLGQVLLGGGGMATICVFVVGAGASWGRLKSVRARRWAVSELPSVDRRRLCWGWDGGPGMRYQKLVQMCSGWKTSWHNG